MDRAPVGRVSGVCEKVRLQGAAAETVATCVMTCQISRGGMLMK